MVVGLICLILKWHFPLRRDCGSCIHCNILVLPDYAVVSLSAQQVSVCHPTCLSVCLVFLLVRPVICLFCLSFSHIVFLCFFVSSFCLSGLLLVSFATGLFVCPPFFQTVYLLFIYLVIVLSVSLVFSIGGIAGPAAGLHCKVLGWLEGTFFQWRCAASNILFVVGCEADLSRLLACWHSDSLWLAAGQNDTHHFQRR